MIRAIVAASLIVPAVGSASAQRAPVIGQETTIPYATGGIRAVRPEGDGSIVLVQDRMLRWYRVTLTGPCFDDRGGALIVRQATAANRLNRFARVSNSRSPERVCGITGIVHAVPPEARATS